MVKQHRLAAWLLTAALCLGLLLSPPAGAADIYLTAINNSLPPLTADTMPLWSGGILYVPYTVFDDNTTGADLGIFASYSRTRSEVTLYILRSKMLVFDLEAGTCRNSMTGDTISAKALLRNGRPYLPLNAVCNFFDLTYSYTAVDQGYLIRIKSDDTVLSDDQFIDAASDFIERRVRDYTQSISSTQAPTLPTSPTEEELVSASDVRTYLAFQCDSATHLTAMLDILDQNRVYGLFLLPPELITQEGDLVRRILGTGHSLGILAQGTSLEQTRALLTEGRRALEQSVCLRVTLACVPNDQRKAMEAEGWVCWTETMALNPSSAAGPNTFAANTLERLEGRTRATYLTLTGDDNTVRVLPALLRELKEERFMVSIPMETRL